MCFNQDLFCRPPKKNQWMGSAIEDRGNFPISSYKKPDGKANVHTENGKKKGFSKNDTLEL